jgi:hemoglobin
MKPDIHSDVEIRLLIDSFYEKVRKSSIVGYIFNDIVKVDWEQHLPVMYSFWGSVLLGSDSYKANPMTKHILLNRKVPLTNEAFEEWVSLFVRTVDELFEGPMADQAKTRASNIAAIMKHKIALDG